MFECGMSESVNKLEGLSKWKTQLAADVKDILKEHRRRSLDLGLPAVPAIEDEAIRYIVVQDTSMSVYEVMLQALGRGGKIDRDLVRRSAKLADVPAFYQAIYAAAHKVELDAVRDAALVGFQSVVTADTALSCLLSENAMFYPDLKTAAMSAVLRWWMDVKPNVRAHIYKVSEGGKLDPHELLKTTVELYERAAGRC